MIDQMIAASIVNLFVLVFIICGMLQMGFSLSIKEIIKPLKNYQLVIGALLANFLLVPLAGYLVLFFIPLETELAVGLALLATAAGAPFLPKLAQIAKGDQAFSVGLMVLLMGITVIYVPVVLPLILGPTVSINPLSIASSLIILMILPLVFALLIRARYRSIADTLRPHVGRASSIALILMTVLILALNYQYVIATIGRGAIIAMIMFALLSLVIGFVAAGKDKKRRSVMGLGTAQRNISAALVIGTQNFASNTDVITMLMVGSIVLLLILFPIAGELGRRAKKTAPTLD